MAKMNNDDQYFQEEASVSDIEKQDYGKNSIAIPVELQIALAKQRIDFAEKNYELTVLKGQVWDHAKRSSKLANYLKPIH